MEYPVQIKRRKILKYLYEKISLLRSHGLVGHIELVNHGAEDFPLVYLGKPWREEESVDKQVGLRGAEVDGLVRELVREDYIEGRWQPERLFPWTTDGRWHISHLTDKGLREIGEIPDPQLQLIQSLDLAILQIQQDPRLSQSQKQQTINWLEEGKIVARTLTIDAIKAILAGAIL